MSPRTTKTLAVILFLLAGVGVIVLRNTGVVDDLMASLLTVALMAGAVATYFVIGSRQRRRASGTSAAHPAPPPEATR